MSKIPITLSRSTKTMAILFLVHLNTVITDNVVTHGDTEMES